MAGVDSVNVSELKLDVVGQRNSLDVSKQTLGLTYKEADKASLSNNAALLALITERNRVTANLPYQMQVLYTPGDILSTDKLNLLALVENKKYTVDERYYTKRTVDNSPVEEGFTTTSRGITLYNPGNNYCFSTPSKEDSYKISDNPSYSKLRQALSFRDNPTINLGDNVSEVFLSCNIYMSEASNFGIYAGTIDDKHGLLVENGNACTGSLYDYPITASKLIPVKIHWSTDKRRYDDLGINGTLTVNIDGKNVIQKNNVEADSVSLSNIVFTGTYDKVWFSDILVTTESIAGQEVYSNPYHIIGGKAKFKATINASTKRHIAGIVEYENSTLLRHYVRYNKDLDFDSSRKLGSYIDGYYTILRRIYTTVDVNHSTLRSLYDGSTVIDDNYDSCRKLYDIPSLDFDTLRKTKGNVSYNFDSRRSVSGIVTINSDTSRAIENERFHIYNTDYDTRREIISKIVNTEGYYECTEIDLGHEYYVGAALEIKGSGYAQIRYAGENHKYSNYEPYNARFLNCRYIQVRLVVRGCIEKAQATIVSPIQEINITRNIPVNGIKVSYGTRFYNVPSVFPSYTDKKVVITNITTTDCVVTLTDNNGKSVAGSVSLLIRG